QVERERGGAGEAAQTAVEIAHRGAEKQASDEAQHRVAEIAVQLRHGAGTDPAPEAVSNDEEIALPQLVDESLQLREVVAIVGVSHDHVTAARRGDACRERSAVASPRHL